MAHRDAWIPPGDKETYHKYHNKKVEWNGRLFDSIAEMIEAQKLVLLEKAGEIRGLKFQPKYILQPGFTEASTKKRIQAITYTGDFEYQEGPLDHPVTVVVDSKGAETQQFLLRAKMLRYLNRDRIDWRFDVIKAGGMSARRRGRRGLG